MTDQEIYLIGHREREYSVYRMDTITGFKPVEAAVCDFVKIGISENPEKRVKNMQTSTPHKLELVTTIAANNAKSVERKLHNILRPYHCVGEWFKITSNEINSLIAIDRLSSDVLDQMDSSVLLSEKGLYVAYKEVSSND